MILHPVEIQMLKLEMGGVWTQGEITLFTVIPLIPLNTPRLTNFPQFPEEPGLFVSLG
jgi:hypothetical protein